MKKFFIIAAGILGGLILLIGILIAVMAFLASSNNAYKGDFKSVFNNNGTSSKKALVVFQPSRTKSSTEIAKQLAKGLNDAGYEVTLSYPGDHLSTDVKDYSVVAFGSPTFGGQPSTILTGFMQKINDYSGKKVILYSIGAMKEMPEIDVLEKCLNGSKAYRKLKFNAGEKNNPQIAYDLGQSIGKE